MLSYNKPEIIRKRVFAIIKVLIADDRIFEREKLRSIVDWTFLGMELAGEAHNGREALDLSRSLHPDIVISDIRMPIMDGIHLARALIDDCPGTKIIFLSAYRDFTYAQQAIEMNICGYLLKPYTEQEISEMLRRTAGIIADEQRRNRQEEKLKEQYQQNLDTLRASFLREFMTSDTLMPEKEFWSQVNALGLNLQFDLFMLLRIALDGHSAPADRQPSRQDIVQTIQSGVAKYCQIYYVFTEQNRAVNVLLNIDENLNQAEIIALVTAIGHAVQDNLRLLLDSDTEITMRNSSSGYGFQSWPRLYSEVHADESRIVHAADPSDTIDQEYQLIKPELFGTIRQQQFQYAGQFIGALLEKAKSMNLSGAQMVKTCIHVCQEIQQLVSEITPAAKLYRLDIAGQMSHILNLRSLSDVESWFKEMLLLSEQYLRSGRKCHNEQIVKSVINIIEDRYGTDIDVASISREVFLSQNYLRQIFKESTGKSLSAYLTDYRLEKACELLTSTAVRIADIPQMVGLASNPHFFYLFKRATNLTPSEYRLHKGLSPLVKL